MARNTQNSTRTSAPVHSISFGQGGANFKTVQELVGQRFTILNSRVKPSPFRNAKPGETITEIRVQLPNDTAVYTVTCSRYMENQLSQSDADDYENADFTIVMAPSKADRDLHAYLQEWDEYWEQNHGDRARINRDKVTREKARPQVTSPDEDEDDEDVDEMADFDESDEDEDDADEIETYTKSEFLAETPKSQARIVKMVKLGTAKIIAEPKASPKAATKAATKPAPKAVKKPSVERGRLIEFGAGEPKGKGRNPTAVNEALDAGHDVYFSLKTRRFLDETKNGPVLAVQKSK